MNTRFTSNINLMLVLVMSLLSVNINRQRSIFRDANHDSQHTITILLLAGASEHRI